MFDCQATNKIDFWIVEKYSYWDMPKQSNIEKFRTSLSD